MSRCADWIKETCFVYKVSRISQIYAHVCMSVAVLFHIGLWVTVTLDGISSDPSPSCSSYLGGTRNNLQPCGALLFIHKPGEHTSASFRHENPFLQAHLCNSLHIPRRPAHPIAKEESKCCADHIYRYGALRYVLLLILNDEGEGLEKIPQPPILHRSAKDPLLSGEPKNPAEMNRSSSQQEKYELMNSTQQMLSSYIFSDYIFLHLRLTSSPPRLQWNNNCQIIVLCVSSFQALWLLRADLVTAVDTGKPRLWQFCYGLLAITTALTWWPLTWPSQAITTAIYYDCIKVFHLKTKKKAKRVSFGFCHEFPSKWIM